MKFLGGVIFAAIAGALLIGFPLQLASEAGMPLWLVYLLLFPGAFATGIAASLLFRRIFGE